MYMVYVDFLPWKLFNGPTPWLKKGSKEEASLGGDLQLAPKGKTRNNILEAKKSEKK